MRIITNNPKAYAYFSERYHNNIVWVDGGFQAVLEKARDLVHLGWRLVNHPLSSSIKPNQTPFKTLVLVKTKMNLDLSSLQVIEFALANVIKLGNFPGASEQVLADLQLIDLELCKSIRLRGEVV